VAVAGRGVLGGACARARRSLDEAEDSVVAADEELARERAEEDQP